MTYAADTKRNRYFQFTSFLVSSIVAILIVAKTHTFLVWCHLMVVSANFFLKYWVWWVGLV